MSPISHSGRHALFYNNFLCNMNPIYQWFVCQMWLVSSIFAQQCFNKS